MNFKVLRSLAAYREHFTSKSIYEVMDMNFTKVKDFFCQSQAKKQKYLDLQKGRSRAIKDTTLIFRCKNLVLESPHTDSGETSAYAMQVDAKRASSVGFYLV